jgi:hypothetical protein
MTTQTLEITYSELTILLEAMDNTKARHKSFTEKEEALFKRLEKML